jgi:hypothetical protein
MQKPDFYFIDLHFKINARLFNHVVCKIGLMSKHNGHDTYFSNLLSRFCQGVCLLWRLALALSGSPLAVTDTEMGVQLFNTSPALFLYSERFLTGQFFNRVNISS